jgi:RecJ-like exonuclease
MAFGILLLSERAKCPSCKGSGRFGLKLCKACNGNGIVSTQQLAERVLTSFGQPQVYTVSHSHSTVLVYKAPFYGEVLSALMALKLSGIKAKLVYHI